MHLTDKHINYLLNLIDTWQPDVFGGLTWGRVLERFKKQFGNAPTERTLRNQTRLQARFQQKKELLRTDKIPISRKPSSLAKAAENIQNLEAKIKALENENQRIFHRLIVWQKNAMDHGMTKKQLEKPLPVTKDTLRNLQGEV
jgi:hypothetical protein